MKKLTYNEFITPGTVVPGDDVVITDYTVKVSPNYYTLINGTATQFIRSKEYVIPLRFVVYNIHTEVDATIYTADMTEEDPLYPYRNDLDSFKVRYSPTPNISLYPWAEYYKGLVLNMEDQYGNSMPYDFINIQFLFYKTKHYAVLGIPENAEQIDIDIFTAVFNSIQNGRYAWSQEVNGEQELYDLGMTYTDYYDLQPDGTRVFGNLGMDFIVELDTNTEYWYWCFHNIADSSGIFPANQFMRNVKIRRQYSSYSQFALPHTVFMVNEPDESVRYRDIDLYSTYNVHFYGECNNIYARETINGGFFSENISILGFYKSASNVFFLANVSVLAFAQNVDTVLIEKDISTEVIFEPVSHQIILLWEDTNYWVMNFNSLQNNDYELRIYNAPGDTPISIIGTKNPISLKEIDDKFMFTSVRTKSGYINVQNNGTVDFHSIFPSSPTNRPVVMYKNGEVEWFGMLKTAAFQTLLFDKFAIQKFQVICPLYLSKNIKYTSLYQPGEMAYIGVVLGSIIGKINSYLPERIKTIYIDYGNNFIGTPDDPNFIKKWFRGKMQNLWFYDDKENVVKSVYNVLEAFCQTFGLTARLYKDGLYLLAVDDSEQGRNVVKISYTDLWLSCIYYDYTPTITNVQMDNIELLQGPFSGTNNTFMVSPALNQVSVNIKKEETRSEFDFIGYGISRKYYYDGVVETSGVVEHESKYYQRFIKKNIDSYEYIDQENNIAVWGSKMRYTAVSSSDNTTITPPSLKDYHPEIKVKSGENTIASTTVPVFLYNCEISLEVEFDGYDDDISPISHGELGAAFYLADTSGNRISLSYVGDSYYYGKLHVESSKTIYYNYNVWVKSIRITITPRVTPYDYPSEYKFENINNGYGDSKSFTCPWTQDNMSSCIRNRLIGLSFLDNEHQDYVHAKHTAERMKAYYEKPRVSYTIELLNKSTMPNISPMSISQHNGKKLYPISVESSYGDDTKKITLVEIED